MDSSSEFRELESQRDRLQKKIELASRDIVKLKREKDEAEGEMRKLMSCEMVRRDLQKEIEVAENELVKTYALKGPDYVVEIQEVIEKDERELKEMKDSSATIREKEQARLDVAQMESSKLRCELDATSSSISALNREISNIERKLKDAAASTNE
ncbi:unnamed protein product [Strongylus vulgaris]|uniref:Uncharacterized protein n=1 Tax=Strongylus vulgaris TaxID=40348 RepID=A0A3P7J2C0_STRVU|nr:unnamed protein product [Strongylus vulgaris]